MSEPTASPPTTNRIACEHGVLFAYECPEGCISPSRIDCTLEGIKRSLAMQERPAGKKPRDILTLARSQMEALVRMAEPKGEQL